MRTNLAGVDALIAELKTTNNRTDNAALEWVRDMVNPQSKLRPTAASLIASILSAGAGEEWGESRAFCGICCASPDNGDDEDDDILSKFEALETSRY